MESDIRLIMSITVYRKEKFRKNETVLLIFLPNVRPPRLTKPSVHGQTDSDLSFGRKEIYYVETVFDRRLSRLSGRQWYYRKVHTPHSLLSLVVGSVFVCVWVPSIY